MHVDQRPTNFKIAYLIVAKANFFCSSRHQLADIVTNPISSRCERTVSC